MAPITPPTRGGSPAATTAGTGLASVVSIGKPSAVEALEAGRVNLGRPENLHIPPVPATSSATLFAPVSPLAAAAPAPATAWDPLGAPTGIPAPAAAIGSPLALVARRAITAHDAQEAAAIGSLPAFPVGTGSPRLQLLDLYPWARPPRPRRLASALSVVSQLADQPIDPRDTARVREAACAIQGVMAHAVNLVVRDHNTAADLLVRPVAFWAAMTQLNMRVPRGRVEENSLDVHPWRGSGEVLRTYAAILDVRGVSLALDLLTRIGIDKLFEVVRYPDGPAFEAELRDAELLMRGVLDARDVVRAGRTRIRERGQTAGVEIEVVAPGKSKDDISRAVAKGLRDDGYDVELVGEGETAYFTFETGKEPPIFLKEYWEFRRGESYHGLELLRGTSTTMGRLHEYSPAGEVVKTDTFEAKQHIKNPKTDEDSLRPARVEGVERVAPRLGMDVGMFQELVRRKVGGTLDGDIQKDYGVEIRVQYLLMMKGGDCIAWISVEFQQDGTAVAKGENAYFNAPGLSEEREYRFAGAKITNIELARAHLVAMAQTHPRFLRKDSPIRTVRARKGGIVVAEFDARYEEHPAFEVVARPLHPAQYNVIHAVAAGLAEVSRGTDQHNAFGVHVHAAVKDVPEAVRILAAHVRHREAMWRFLSPEEGRQYFMAAYIDEYMGRVTEEGYLMDLDPSEMPEGVTVEAMRALVFGADYVHGARPKYAEINADPFVDWELARLIGERRLKDGQVIVFAYRGRKYTFTVHVEDLSHGKYGVTALVQGVRQPVDWPTDELVRSSRTPPIPTFEDRRPNTSMADHRIDPAAIVASLDYWASFVALGGEAPMVDVFSDLSVDRVAAADNW